MGLCVRQSKVVAEPPMFIICSVKCVIYCCRPPMHATFKTFQTDVSFVSAVCDAEGGGRQGGREE